ncbi:hypothetical protein CCM_02575 [Cordyceps militaris CM01]|uniref:Uncharacterized protein n=1 Tax=Cordyceps militaris (strain CM01) TaxID=983644 RepID=G3JAI8_CORMM|nr:uncharacterized protein CCM_02575 [Cordyceps militaris CM01]EGX94304.1 hypothetical protein CCM_02575 [Cordyceps militaris CM01]
MGAVTVTGVRDDLFLRAVEPLLSSYDPYVSEATLKELGITLKHLDLETGDIDHVKGSARMVPMSADIVRQTPGGDGLREPLEGKNTDVRSRAGFDWVNEMRNDADARFFQAFFIHNLVDSYECLWKFPAKAQWRFSRHETDYLYNLDQEGRVCYQIQTVSEPVGKDGKLDPSRPCIVAYQLDNSWLQDGRLLLSELNALIVLASKYDMDPAYAKYDELVITVITGCDRQVRVAQSRVNLAKQTFDVCLSRILDFEESVKGKWDDWTTLLGWLACSVTPPAQWT